MLLLFAAAVEVLGQSSSVTPSDLLGLRRRASGQGVVPVFEGFEPNPDGTFSLCFGYQSRNWEEELDIPVGPNNFFAPGSEDRGQPTHFLARRHKANFGVVVPKDFGDETLVWTLTIRGRTEKASGSLKNATIYQIDKSRRPETGNAPPKIDFGPDQSIVFPQSATLSATITDDGLPKAGSGESEGRGGLRVHWRKYRGPGTVTFSNATSPPISGKAVTTATFSEPGVYVLQALADDGSMLDGSNESGIPGFMCCWTTAVTTVTVKPAPTPATPR